MKVKTKKIVAKRFHVTKSGILLHRRQGFRHLRRRKSKSKLRQFAVKTKVSPSMEKAVRGFLPYT